MGWDGWDGIGSPGGRGYRAPYGANNVLLLTKVNIEEVEYVVAHSI